jgi:hypothetical protein
LHQDAETVAKISQHDAGSIKLRARATA